jgi:outer membrane protein OmpA-like peptidoglycan-associated protein
MRLDTRTCGALTLLIAATLAFAWPSPGHAQDRFNLQNLRPAPAWSTGTIATHGASTLPHGAFDFQLLVHHAESPLTLFNDGGGTEGRIVRGITALDLTFAAGIGSRFEIGAVLSAARAGAGTSIQGFRREPLADDTYALADFRIIPKLNLWTADVRRARADDAFARGLALALVADVALPTGSKDAYLGDGGFRADPALALDVAYGRGHLLAFNVGYRFRPTTEIGPVLVTNAVTAAAGADVRIIDEVHILADVTAAVHQAKSLGAEDIPVEALLTGRFQAGPVAIHAGGGAGLTTGVGAPDWRVLLGVASSAQVNLDRDDDGIPNRRDDCPREAEDIDGFEDGDGCPDADNDGDGIPDAQDACPDQAEDIDGMDDGDGCPDGDNDGDGIPDTLDACPDQAEDIDGFEDGDGCPDGDNDGDGIPDVQDACPDQAGADDGCPDEVDVLAPVVVYFEFDSTELSDEAAAAVERLAATLATVGADGAESGARIVVEGHADSRGSDRYNQRISEERAAAVRTLLVERGVDPDHIETSGYGSTRPATAGETEEERALNRRVEIRVAD